MARVVLVAGLALDQVGDPPAGPEPGAVSQDLGPFLETPSQGLQLGRLQPGFAPSPTRLFEAGLAGAPPLPIPTPRRLPGNPGLPRHLGLAHALVEEPGRTKTPLFQLVEVPLNTSWIAHAPKATTRRSVCHYIMRHSIKCLVPYYIRP